MIYYHIICGKMLVLLEKMERELESDGKHVEMVVWQDLNENIIIMILIYG